MPSNLIPLEAVAGYAETFRWTLRDLSAADNRVGAAKRALESRKGDFVGRAYARMLNDWKPTTADLLYKAMNGRTREEAEQDAALEPFRQALRKEEEDRDQLRRRLEGLADKLIDGAIELGVQDTTPLTVF